ncbi:MAG TPA: tRNA pseudouridine(38-40) synthase TruA [Syntrophales bacterium]|nr:tRNA pseudouridine(38-40) synthase TruA [Syntrophales bacterium]
MLWLRKYKITLEYDGTSYRGWQSQKNAKTVQDTLIHAAEKMFGVPVEIQGAGRTDAGVHALAQVAHLGSAKAMAPRKIMEGLNDLLPSNINILDVEEVSGSFHARHYAKARSYSYIISRHRTAFGKRYVWWVRDNLDVKKMQAAAHVFQGFHDFASFADKRMDKDTSTKVKLDTVAVTEADGLIVFRVVGSHFLWKMVRRIAGILVEVGRGNLSVAEVRPMLEGHSELPAKHTAPPSGLFLEHVFYEGESEKTGGRARLFHPIFPALANIHR